MSNKRLYSIWSAMKNRCNNPNSQSAKYYFRKGIRVCEPWNDYKCFEEWALSNGYEENLTIDRIDNSGNYEPSNCRWITKSENSRHATQAKKGIWNIYEGKKWLFISYPAFFFLLKPVIENLSYSEALKKEKELEKLNKTHYFIATKDMEFRKIK